MGNVKNVFAHRFICKLREQRSVVQLFQNLWISNYWGSLKVSQDQQKNLLYKALKLFEEQKTYPDTARVLQNNPLPS